MKRVPFSGTLTSRHFGLDCPVIMRRGGRGSHRKSFASSTPLSIIGWLNPTRNQKTLDDSLTKMYLMNPESTPEIFRTGGVAVGDMRTRQRRLPVTIEKGRGEVIDLWIGLTRHALMTLLKLKRPEVFVCPMVPSSGSGLLVGIIPLTLIGWEGCGCGCGGGT